MFAHSQRRRRWRLWIRFVSIYRTFAVIFLNATLLMIAVTLMFSSVMPLLAPTRRHQDLPPLRAFYPDHTSSEINLLIAETRSRPLEFRPFTQFKERPFSGRYVNVHSAGYRLVKNQGPWPPYNAYTNVFVFGGSTTFGYGIGDHETLPSALQELLNTRAAHGDRSVRVYNFGCAFYYSTQERILFQQLLAEGITPHVAVFVDGLNEFHTTTEVPPMSTMLHEVVEARTALRMGRLNGWLAALNALTIEPGSQTTRSYDASLAKRLVDRYRRNKAMTESVARAFGVKALFVWQPISMYDYDLRRHPTGARDAQPLPGVGYERMVDALRESPYGPEFLWAANIQRTLPDPLYVDSVHYSATLCRALADVIATALRERNYV